jgi:hypothetical protein
MYLIGLDDSRKSDRVASLSGRGGVSLKSSRFNVQGSTWTRLPVSLNFEPGTLNSCARSLRGSLRGVQNGENELSVWERSGSSHG